MGGRQLSLSHSPLVSSIYQDPSCFTSLPYHSLERRLHWHSLLCFIHNNFPTLLIQDLHALSVTSPSSGTCLFWGELACFPRISDFNWQVRSISGVELHILNVSLNKDLISCRSLALSLRNLQREARGTDPHKCHIGCYFVQCGKGCRN